MIAKPIAANRNPKANFAGLVGFFPRLPIPIQIEANTGASKIMKKELADWNQVAGISQPKTTRLVKSFAKRFSDVGACSNADQKMEANTNRIAITTIRFFSSLV